MQPEVDVLARGVFCVTLVIVGTWGSDLLVAFEFFYYQLAVPSLPCPTLMLLESPSIFSCLTAPAQSPGSQGQLRFSHVLTLHPPSFPALPTSHYILWLPVLP